MKNKSLFAIGAMLVLMGDVAEARNHVLPRRSYEYAAEKLFDYQLSRVIAVHVAMRESGNHRLPDAPWWAASGKSGVNPPARICADVRRRVRYVSDAGPEDQWKDAQTTWESRTGDCEDFAVCVKQRCIEWGNEAEVYRLYPSDGQIGHVVAIGRWAGRTWVSSNGDYHEAPSVAKAIRDVACAMGWDPAGVEVVVGARLAGLDRNQEARRQ